MVPAYCKDIVIKELKLNDFPLDRLLTIWTDVIIIMYKIYIIMQEYRTLLNHDCKKCYFTGKKIFFPLRSEADGEKYPDIPIPTLCGLETYRKIQYAGSEASLYFWRINHGAEVDLLIEKHGTIRAACEIKSSSVIQTAHLSGLRAFKQEHHDIPCYVISLPSHPYKISEVKVLPWIDF